MIVEIDRDRAAAPFDGVGSEQTHQRFARTVFHGSQVFQQPARQRFDPFADDVIADGFDVFQPDFNGGDIEVIERAVFESGSAVGEIIFVALAPMRR